jgi:hypothetical protein
MPYQTPREMLPRQIGDVLRSEAFRRKANGVPLEQLRELVSAELRTHGINVVVTRVQIAGLNHHGTHRLVWQPPGGGQFIEQFFTLPS